MNKIAFNGVGVKSTTRHYATHHRAIADGAAKRHARIEALLTRVPAYYASPGMRAERLKLEQVEAEQRATVQRKEDMRRLAASVEEIIQNMSRPPPHTDVKSVAASSEEMASTVQQMAGKCGSPPGSPCQLLDNDVICGVARMETRSEISPKRCRPLCH
jgi:hypothetical protein